MVYSYDELGQLVAARNLALGQWSRYSYSLDGEHLLTLVAASTGELGEAIAYGSTPVVLPVLKDLGSAAMFTADATDGSLSAGETDRYSFSLRGSELRSGATGFVLLGFTLLFAGQFSVLVLTVISSMK